MRFKGRMELEHGLKQIDIVPLINIVFLLLIFFMLTSSFVMQPGLKINLPKVVTSEVVKYENVEILVNSENVIYLNGSTVTQEELKSFLREAGKRNQTVLIKADARASLGRVVEIWDTCRDLGLTQINIATNQE